MKKERKAEEDRILHKFKNRKFDLEMQQKQEKLLSENKNMMKSSNDTIMNINKNTQEQPPPLK